MCGCVRACAHFPTYFPFLKSSIMEKHFVLCETGPKYLL